MGAYAPPFEEEDEEIFNAQLEQLLSVAHTHKNKALLDSLTAEMLASKGERYYKKIFTASDWEQCSQYSSLQVIKIQKSEHGFTDPYLDAYFILDEDGSYKEAIPSMKFLSISKAVLIHSYEKQSGFLILKDAEN